MFNVIINKIKLIAHLRELVPFKLGCIVRNNYVSQMGFLLLKNKSNNT